MLELLLCTETGGPEYLTPYFAADQIYWQLVNTISVLAYVTFNYFPPCWHNASFSMFKCQD